MAWRYLAQRLTGDGRGTFIDMALPLRGVSIEHALSGPDRLTATIDPKVARLVADDGRPVLEEWSTAIFAEQDGNIEFGGILAHSEFDGPSWSLDVTGFTGYAQGMPYTGAKFFVETDPLDIVRHIWDHLQGQVDGDIGLQVDATKSPVRIGQELKQVEFDTQAGPVSFEAGPYKLAWYQTDDLGRAVDDLASETPFEYLEEHRWNGEGGIDHLMRIGYPRIGTRREELRFVVGENVSNVPTVERNGEDYANEILALGSGEGRDMLRGSDSNRDGRLRRVAIVTDKAAQSKRAVQNLARRALAEHQPQYGVAEVQVLDHPHAPIGSFRPGDEIRVQGSTGWVAFDDWYRVLSTTVSPDDASAISCTIARSETVTP